MIRIMKYLRKKFTRLIGAMVNKSERYNQQMFDKQEQEDTEILIRKFYE